MVVEGKLPIFRRHDHSLESSVNEYPHLLHILL